MPSQSYGRIVPSQSYGCIVPSQSYGHIVPSQSYDQVVPSQSHGHIVLMLGSYWSNLQTKLCSNINIIISVPPPIPWECSAYIGQVIYALCFGVTSAAYVLLTTLGRYYSLIMGSKRSLSRVGGDFLLYVFSYFRLG